MAEIKEFKGLNKLCSICEIESNLCNYICCICSNCFICDKCETKHIHPVIKINNAHLSSLPDIYNYLKCHHMKKSKKQNFFGNIFNKEHSYTFNLKARSTMITMGTNDTISIPFIIENKSNHSFDQNLKLTLVASQINDLKYSNMNINNTFDSREVIEHQAEFQSNSFEKDYEIIFELYSSSVVLSNNIVTIKISVKNSSYDKELNDYFSKYPNILILSSEQKEIIKKILYNEFSTDHPYIILSVCINANWNYEQIVNELLEKEHENNQIKKNKLDCLND